MEGKKIYFLLILLASCSPSKHLSTVQNYAYLYKKKGFHFSMEHTVFQKNDSSIIYLKIFPAEFTSKDLGGVQKANLTISYKYYDSIDENKFIDSNSYKNIIIPKNLNSYIYTINLKAEVFSGLVILTLYDNLGKQGQEYLISLNREEQSKQYYQCFQKKELLFTPYIDNSEPVKVINKDQNSAFSVNYYNRKFPVAEPPFALDNISSFNYTADSSFQVNDSVKLIKEGFYHFQTDQTQKFGFTLFRVYNGFPEIKSATHLIEPVRYITTAREYEELTFNKNPKQAVDKFWLDIGQEPERTKELIKKYYSRVVAANRLFSSYKEGWKTDRGMIFIVYGSPDIVYKTSNSESWIYGEEGSMLSLNFTFVKVINPFSDQDYTLSRAPYYQNHWYSAVDSWRHGRAFNDY